MNDKLVLVCPYQIFKQILLVPTPRPLLLDTQEYLPVTHYLINSIEIKEIAQPLSFRKYHEI